MLIGAEIKADLALAQVRRPVGGALSWERAIETVAALNGSKRMNKMVLHNLYSPNVMSVNLIFPILCNLF
jgi:hypothetical protein